MKLTEKHEHTIANGMRVAAEEYGKHAEEMRKENPQLHERTIAQFERQQREALAIALHIDEYGLLDINQPNPICICKMSPDGHNAPNQEQFLLEHRCPKHGEKAQPNVWGRHKELELYIDVRTYRILAGEAPDGKDISNFIEEHWQAALKTFWARWVPSPPYNVPPTPQEQTIFYNGYKAGASGEH